MPIAAIWPALMKKFTAAVRVGRRGRGAISEAYNGPRVKKKPRARPLTYQGNALALQHKGPEMNLRFCPQAGPQRCWRHIRFQRRVQIALSPGQSLRVYPRYLQANHKRHCLLNVIIGCHIRNLRDIIPKSMPRELIAVHNAFQVAERRSCPWYS